MSEGSAWPPAPPVTHVPGADARDPASEVASDDASYWLGLLEVLLDRVPDFFYVHDEDLRFRYANKAAAEYFGQTKQSIVGLRHRDVDERDQAEFYEQVLIPIMLAGNPHTTPQLPYVRRDGTPGLLRASIVPFDDPKTGKRMMLGMSRDVTDEVRVADERRVRAAFERELEIAARVQQSLLPTSVPSLAGYELAGRCEPAAFIGGDFFDYIQTSTGVIALVGDVSGHGIGSALLAASCRAAARVLFSRLPFESAIALLDETMRPDLIEGNFITFAAAHLGDSGVVRYFSAGHGPVAILPRDASGALRRLPAHAPPLGVWNQAPDPLTAYTLAPGDCLVIPSDGLVESCAGSEDLGIDRLCQQACSGNVATRLTACFEREAQWRGETPPKDDRTAVLVLRT
jgi:PAS domain S-box-containing protein